MWLNSWDFGRKSRDTANVGIFISYQRDDSEGQAGRLFEGLKARFGQDRVFIDVAGIEPGRDFRRVVRDGACCRALPDLRMAFIAARSSPPKTVFCRGPRTFEPSLPSSRAVASGRASRITRQTDALTLPNNLRGASLASRCARGRRVGAREVGRGA